MVSKRRDKAAARAFFRKAFLFNRKPLHTASRTIAGIELMNMIKKKQLKFIYALWVRSIEIKTCRRQSSFIAWRW
tara:strand:- start:36 stop:260 length:225 start_codon:yes stop_codon:yes gene_type:complete